MYVTENKCFFFKKEYFLGGVFGVIFGQDLSFAKKKF
jgi:hypothetical protein